MTDDAPPIDSQTEGVMGIAEGASSVLDASVGVRNSALAAGFDDEIAQQIAASFYTATFMAIMACATADHQASVAPKPRRTLWDAVAEAKQTK